MATIELPGLRAPADRHGPQQRRAWLIQALNDGQARAALVDACVALCVGQRAALDAALPALAASHRVDPGELVASPFGLRACALGIAVGASVSHIERRRVAFWRAELRPLANADDPQASLDAGVADPDNGCWRDGVLLQGRYQDFALEAPHASFDPNNSARWTPHELLHRAVGFAYRPDASRFWIAIGARLAELLPVVHWYGPDQMARLDGAIFDRQSDATQVEARMADVAWWQAAATPNGLAALRDQIEASVDWLGRGARHLEAELAACREALACGRWRSLRGDPAIVDGELDAATDAQAYALAHHRRLRDPIVEAALLAHTQEGVERFSDLAAFADHVERCFDALIFGTIELVPTEVERRRRARAKWDAALLAAVTGEPWAGDDYGDGDGDADDSAIDDWPLRAGLDQTVPELIAWLRRQDPGGAILRALAREMSAGRRGPFWMRLQAALEIVAPDDEVARALAAAALCVAGTTEIDDQIECLAEPLDSEEDDQSDGQALDDDDDDDDDDDLDDERIWIVRSAAFQALTATCDVFALREALVQDDPRLAGPTIRAAISAASRHWLVGRNREGVVVVPCPRGVIALWGALGAGALEVDACFAELDEALQDDAAALGLDAAGWLDELRLARAIGLLRVP